MALFWSVPFAKPTAAKSPAGTLEKIDRIDKGLLSRNFIPAFDFFWPSGIFRRRARLCRLNPQRSFGLPWKADLTAVN